MTIENILFDLADALRYPVLILAVVALVWSIVESGRLIAEVVRRRSRGVDRLEKITHATRSALAAGDVPGAVQIVRTAGYSHEMAETLTAIVELRDAPDASDRIAKRMADFDYGSMKQLERTRILVRVGPALGLMGTLIPLSPALAGLAKGDVEQLTQDLRVAFSVTVVGLLAGGLAFAVSLVRERLYAQDYSDVEFVAVKVAEPLTGVVPAVPSPGGPYVGPAAHPSAVPASQELNT
jgi:biopolymer transport protein ExbB/TolQ